MKLKSLFLFQDDMPEETEGIRLSVASQGGVFPNFQPANNMPTPTLPAFQDTVIRIMDNDSKIYSSLCLQAGKVVQQYH